MDKTINISVSNLVEFIMRQGNIDSVFLGSKRMQEGIVIHQKIQKMRKKDSNLHGYIYESEISLKHSFLYDDFVFNIEGRADGIFTKENSVTVEELKSTTQPLSEIIFNKTHNHWGQAKVYGYILCLLRELNVIDVSLTYVSCENLDTIVFNETLTIQELHDFFYDLLSKYLIFAKMDYERISLRNGTAKNLSFPYSSYRKNQRNLMVAVYTAIKNKKKLFCQAPTGIGKTISTLFPSVKALSENLAQKIFYLTAKTITRKVAEEACLFMYDNGLRMRVISLTGKEKICTNKNMACNPVECIYANGHFDRVNAAIIDIITNEYNITRTQIEDYAKKYNICPFEFSLDLTYFCDCIICDYNYVYDPKVQLKRFFQENKDNNYILLSDEAHNLVDRSRDMFSAKLSRTEFLDVRKMILNKKHPIYKSISKINRYFEEIRKSYFVDTNTAVLSSLPPDFTYLLYDFKEHSEKWLLDFAGDEAYSQVLNLFFKALDFIRISELFDEHYKLFLESTNKKEISIKLLCIDPSFLLSQIKVICSVYFSATLTPLTYFRDILGGETTDYTLKVSSPFKQENLCLMIDNSISTKYKDRDTSYQTIICNIFKFVNCKKGNYFVFFSSYEYMSKTLSLFNENYPHIQTLFQKQDMTEEDREHFLHNFADVKDADKDTIVAFLVLGGIFSEGIDLPQDRLIGAIIVGVGLPLITEERNIISHYYRENNKDGFEYAYVYPGMNKVLQAAGRVIRTEQDKGAVLLIDNRLLNSTYTKLFPQEWSHYVKLNKGISIENILNQFWKDE